MARACVYNNEKTKPMVDKLMSEGKIEKYWAMGEVLCFKFDGKLKIDIADYGGDPLKAEDVEMFRMDVIDPFVKSLDGGYIEDISHTFVEASTRGLYELVCFKMNSEDKEKLKSIAEARGISLSYLLRSLAEKYLRENDKS